MISIENAILHILDFNSGVTVISDEELGVQDEDALLFLNRHFEKAMSDNDLKSGSFKENSELKQQLGLYINGTISFYEISIIFAKKLLEALSAVTTKEFTDIVISRVTSNGKSYLGILFLSNKPAYTHQVKSEGTITKNEIIKHYAILPTPSQKIDTMAFIDLGSLSIRLKDKKALYLDKETWILSDLVLSCTFGSSANDVTKSINRAVLKIAEKHGKNTAIAASKTKNYFQENAEISDRLEVSSLGREVFFDSEIMQNEFIDEVSTAGIPSQVCLERNSLPKSLKTHKIKTDTGIEITFPVDYFANRDYIDFINNPDGTLSIELKNIGKIINK